MNSKPENGRRALELSWYVNGAWGSVRPGEGEEYVYSSEYYGDHTENWILVMKNGVEIRRHNVAHMETIEWEVVDETKTDEDGKEGAEVDSKS